MARWAAFKIVDRQGPHDLPFNLPGLLCRVGLVLSGVSVCRCDMGRPPCVIVWFQLRWFLAMGGGRGFQYGVDRGGWRGLR